MNIADIRKDYQLQSLSESDVHSNPIAQFAKWWDEAMNSNIDEVNAMSLATANKSGVPSVRIVLLKGFSEKGFSFFTNYESRKGREIVENPVVSLAFFWKELQRQVCVSGTIEKLTASESDEYFFSRPAGSRIGAWSSPQSSVISDRSILENNVQKYTEKFGENIPRPAHWGGFLVIPNKIEFWQGRSSRLHDRILYTKQTNQDWKIERLAP
ncbi:MAG: pyridoxamine 5'-phosphate oxidase [Chitinophagaceae bacterium]